MALWAISSMERSANAIASCDSNGMSSLNRASANPITPRPTGRWRRFEARASGVG